MSCFDELCERLRLRVNPEVREAAHILERTGLRFLIDFGYMNAVDKAAEYVVLKMELELRRES